MSAKKAARFHAVASMLLFIPLALLLLNRDRSPLIALAPALGLWGILQTFNRPGQPRRNIPFHAVCSVFLFFLLLAAPFSDRLFQFSGKVKLHPLQEKRNAAIKPDISTTPLQLFPTHYTAYYNDHFNFRNIFIYFHNLAVIRLFNTSPLDSVLVGREGWLFYARESETVNEMDYYRAVKPFAPEELERWKTVLEERRNQLAGLGIRYLLAIAPNKSAIYPEYLPERIRPPKHPNRLDQLLEYMKSRSDVPILDLRPALLAAKKKSAPLYHKTDSHWNEYGAYFAYAEIIKHFSREFPQAQPIPLRKFRLNRRNRVGGDLAILLYMQKREFREERVGLNPQPPFNARPVPPLLAGSSTAQKAYKAFQSSSATLPGAVMVHDSFAEALKPYLSENFSRIAYIHDWEMGFYPEVIAAEKPAIVLDEMAERFLMDKKPANKR